MNITDPFQKLIRLRTIFKNVVQVSWAVTQLERRYPIDTMSQAQAETLIEQYQAYADDLMSTVAKLKKEKGGEIL